MPADDLTAMLTEVAHHRDGEGIPVLWILRVLRVIDDLGWRLVRADQ